MFRLERPGFHKFVDLRSPSYADRCVHLVADSDEQLPVFGSEPFVVAAGNDQSRRAGVGRAFAVDLERLAALLACDGRGICGRRGWLRQERAVVGNSIGLVDGEDHLHGMPRHMTPATPTSGQVIGDQGDSSANRPAVWGTCPNDRVAAFLPYFSSGRQAGVKSGSDGTRTRDLRRDRPAF
jgi:hypothetical protein